MSKRSTRFTELLDCELPIQVSPMGQVTTPEMVAAVTRAGAHAVLGLSGMPLGPILEAIDRTRELGARAFGANLLVPFAAPQLVEAVASQVPLVDFFLGPPERWLIDLVHAKGALVSWQVTSLEEAEAAEAAGCDLIVAHGVEAGGRNPGGIGLIPLLAQVLDRVSVPVVAAGGIGTGRGVAAALAAGADAVRLGTRFIAAAESGAHPRYVEALLRARSEDAVRTDTFHLLFPPHLFGSRVLRSSAEAAASGTGEVVGEAVAGDVHTPVQRFSPSPPLASMTGEIEAMPFYAGESVHALTRVQPAAEILADLVAEADRCIERIAGR